jgi:hypothetical protein
MSESEANMTRLERQPHQRLTLVFGLVAAFAWTSLGLRAIVTDNDPSSRALFACAALVLAGVALGSVVWILAAPRRAKQRPVDAVMRAESKAPNALLGIMLIGLGADSILDPSPDVRGWTFLVATSLVGGLNLGVAFMGFADQASPCTDEPSATRSGFPT